MPADMLVDSAQSPKRLVSPEGRMTLRKTLSYLYQDSRRKRLQMGKRPTPRSILLGFFSINVIAVAIWRFSMFFKQRGWKTPAFLLYYLNILLFGFDGSPLCSIGPGVVVAHLVGCVIHAKVGKNCTFYGRNGLGGIGRGDAGGWYGGPILGDNVIVGFGAAVVSHEAIGDNVTISAGSWCYKGIPSNSIVFGVPARILRAKTEEELREEARAHGA